jgi:hypothetical protein
MPKVGYNDAFGIHIKKWQKSLKKKVKPVKGNPMVNGLTK